MHHSDSTKGSCFRLTVFVLMDPGYHIDQEATRSKGHRYERSKDATNGAPGLTTRNKNATRNKDGSGILN